MSPKCQSETNRAAVAHVGEVTESRLSQARAHSNCETGKVVGPATTETARCHSCQFDLFGSLYSRLPACAAIAHVIPYGLGKPSRSTWSPPHKDDNPLLHRGAANYLADCKHCFRCRSHSLRQALVLQGSTHTAYLIWQSAEVTANACRPVDKTATTAKSGISILAMISSMTPRGRQK